MIPEPIKVEVPQQDEEVSKALALVKQRDAEIATLKSEVAALKVRSVDLFARLCDLRLSCSGLT